MKKITGPQMKSVHKLFQNIADELNDRGIERKVVLAKTPEVNWTKENIKEDIWRPFMKGIMAVDSTTELYTSDVDQIFKEIHKFFASNWGIDYRFPSVEEIIMQQRIKEGEVKK